MSKQDRETLGAVNQPGLAMTKLGMLGISAVLSFSGCIEIGDSVDSGEEEEFVLESALTAGSTSVSPAAFPYLLQPQANVWYSVRSKSEGTYFAAPTTARGAGVALADRSGLLQDQLLLSFGGSGPDLTAVLVANKLRLSASTRRTHLVQSAVANGKRIAFSIRSADKGESKYFRLIHNASGKCAQASKAPRGPRVLLGPCLAETDPNVDAQRWEFTPQKKGAAFRSKDEGWETRVKILRPAWYYTWGAEKKATTPPGIQFVPMIWGYYGMTEGFKLAIQTLAGWHPEQILGFNEPDQKGQADLRVERALEAWPSLESIGARLGSPAPAHALPAKGELMWLSDFLLPRPHVDFVAVHWYGGANAKSLMTWVKNVCEKYGKPIWITEFAVADWGATAPTSNSYTPEQVQEFMKEALPMLDAEPCVERYAWFPFSQTSAVGAPSALLDASGNLTELGKIYSAYPERP
jgi:Glycosyl hydrolase catalytic core